jgi:hypothetical protein
VCQCSQGNDRAVEESAWRQGIESLGTVRDRHNSQKFIAFSGDPYWAANVTEFAHSYFVAAWKLFVLGVLSGRLAVFPLVDCSSPWISHDRHARSGIDQVHKASSFLL